MAEVPHPSDSHVGTGRRSDGLDLDRVTALILRVLARDREDHPALSWSADELAPFVTAAEPFAALESSRSIASRLHPLERHGFVRVVARKPRKRVRLTAAGRAYIEARDG